MALSIGQATATSPSSVRSANSDPTKKKKNTHSATAASQTPNSLRVPKASVRSMSVRSADAEAAKNKKIVDNYLKAMELNLLALANGNPTVKSTYQGIFNNAETAYNGIKKDKPDLTEEIAVYTARNTLAEKQAALKAQLLIEGSVTDFDEVETSLTTTARTDVENAIKQLKEALDKNPTVNKVKAENQINEAARFTDKGMVKEFRNIHGFETAVTDYSKKVKEYLGTLDTSKGKTPAEITAAKEALDISISVIEARANNLASDDKRINVTNALFWLDTAEIEFARETRRINDLNTVRGGDPKNHEKIRTSFAENVTKAEAELVKAFGLEDHFQTREEAFKVLDPANKATVAELGKAKATILEAEKNITQQLELGLTAPHTAELKTLVDEIIEARKTEQKDKIDKHITKVQKEYEEAAKVLTEAITESGDKTNISHLYDELKALFDAESEVKATVDFLKLVDPFHAKKTALNDLVTTEERKIDTAIGTTDVLKNVKEAHEKAREQSNPSASNNEEIQELTDKYEDLERAFADLKANPVVQAGKAVNTAAQTVADFSWEKDVPQDVRDKLEKVSTHKPNTLLTVGIAAGAAAISGIVAYIAAISGNTTKKDDKTSSVKG